jgi:hypothetical protein
MTTETPSWLYVSWSAFPLKNPAPRTEQEFVEFLEVQRFEAIVRAKGDYCCTVALIHPEIVIMKVCELVLLLIGPKARAGIAVPDWVNRGVVPAAKLGGKREVFFQVGTVGYEIDGFERALSEKRVDA